MSSKCLLVSDTSLSLSLSLAPGLWCQNSGSECQSQLRPGLAWPVRPRLWLWQLARVFRYVNTYRGETSDNISTTSLQKTDSGPQPKTLLMERRANNDNQCFSEYFCCRRSLCVYLSLRIITMILSSILTPC